MGFFSFINRIVQPVLNNPIKAIKSAGLQAINNPFRVALGVTTGGLSEVYRKAPIIGNSYTKIVDFQEKGLALARNIYTGGLTGQATGLANQFLMPREEPMAINLGGVFENVGKIFNANSGGGNNIFGTIGQGFQLASQFTQPRMIPVTNPTAPIIAGAVIPRIMAAAGLATRGAVVSRGFFSRYPNLAAGIQQLRTRGQLVKRSQLFSMLKRFGPEILVSGGLLTAAAVNELMVAGAGHRRMNPGNIKALRKSMRRVEAFHKICGRADKLTRPRRRSTNSSAKVSQFVRQG